MADHPGDELIEINLREWKIPVFERLADMAIFEPDTWVFMKYYD